MIYSNSRLDCFSNCPKQFEYRYILKPEVPAHDSIESFMGKRVHETLEHFYRDLHLTKNNSLKELENHYSKIWKEHWKKDVVLRDGYSQKHFFDLGKKCLKNFYHDVHQKHNGDVIGIEKRVQLKIGSHLLQGYIDLLVKAGPNHYQIIDYKTGSLKDQNQVDKDEQLALYQIAIQEQFPDAKKVDLVWHYLAYNHTATSQRTLKQLEALKTKIETQIKQIESTKNFETKVSPLCGYCAYKSLCPAWKHQEMLKALPKTQYKKEEGLILADEYAKTYNELKKIEKELDSQLKVLKEKIFEYAKQHEFEVVQGTNCKLKLKIEEKVSLPGKNTEERKFLEDLIQKHNLWNELSELDIYKVKRYLEEGKFDGKLSKELMKTAKKSETKSITMSKK